MNARQRIGIFSLVMINFAAIANVRTLPSVAPYGLSMLFFYSVAVFCFLIPSALVSAELASGDLGNGGIYNWVSHAFGPRVGFFAVWLQNANNFICFPMALSFIASTMAYGIFPQLVDSKIFTLSVIIIVIWGGTFLTLGGVKLTGFISAIGGIIGTFIPVALMVGIGIFWLISGRQSQIEFSVTSLVPDLSSAANVSLFLGVLLGFAGLEMSANHIQDVDNPQKQYPRAMFISSFLILAVCVLGSLAIAIVIPANEITMNGGAMQVLAAFFAEVKMSWVMPVLSCAMIIGSIAWFCAWVSGPPRALHATTYNGDLPRWFHRLNRNNMPTNIMIAQAFISSILSVLFIFAESINTAFTMLTVATTQFLLLMYVIMFLSAIVLKFRHPNMICSYKVPFGKFGMCVVAGTGLVVCALFYVIGFFPPNAIGIQNKSAYFFTILTINIVLGFLPYVSLQIFQKPSWKNNHKNAPRIPL
ncbi:MAG: APC family permease [Puniceicoccales bacterium]|jgi:amino acid transporter|nr:APC family permease [Puniceicoccales bacterium]